MRKERLRLELEFLRLMAESIKIQEIERGGQTIPVFRDASGKFASKATTLNTPDNQEQIRQTINYAIAQIGDLKGMSPNQRMLAVKKELEKQGLPADDIAEACKDYLETTNTIQKVIESLDKAEEKHPRTAKGIETALDIYGSPEDAKLVAEGIKQGLKETNETIKAVDQGLYDAVGIAMTLLDNAEKEKTQPGIEGELKTAIAAVLSLILYLGIPNIAAVLKGKDIMIVLANLVGMKTLLKSLRKYLKEHPELLKVPLPPEKLGYLIGVTLQTKGGTAIKNKLEDKEIEELTKDLLALREEALQTLQT